MTGHPHRQQRRVLPSRLGRDDGVATAGMLLAIPAVVIAIGFVLDVGVAIRGWNTAHDLAASAARAGAQQIDLGLYRQTGVIQLDPQAAADASNAFLAAAGATGTASVTGDAVTVTVTRTTPTQLLNLVGVGSFTEHATATARPLHGVVGPTG
jgi:Flp pilus assembly protein TadG